MTSNSISTGDLAVAFILISFVGLVGGGIIEWFVEHKLAGKVPCTVIVFFAGAVVSLILFYSVDASSPARLFIDESTLVSDIILYLFLPVLIFSEAMSLNWHRSIRALYQSLLLAGPGVAIGTMLTAVCAKYLNEWSFHACCTFGAILSATDPVAVVALLKSTGAPSDLTMLIVGESLLNDGSAIFMYQLFLNIALGLAQDPATIVFFFFKNALGSVFFGIGVGFVTNAAMRGVDNPFKKVDMAVQVAATICATYVSFVVAQYVLQISGVLSASAAGLIVARFAPPFILHHKSMHRVWRSLEWICNTLIFYFAGFSAADRTIKYCRIIDLWMIPLMYLVIMWLRTIMIAVLYPILKLGLVPITLKRCVFMNWAGLRGALAIALVLNLESSGVFGAETSHQIFIQTIGVVALTLLINGTTSKWLIDYLQLSERYIQDEDIAELTKTLVMRKMTKAVDEKMLDCIYGISAESVAGKYCTFLNTSSITKSRDTFSIKREMLTKKESDRQKGAIDRTEANERLRRRLSAKFVTGKGNIPAGSPAGSPSGSPRVGRIFSGTSGKAECDSYLLSYLRMRFYDNLSLQYHSYVNIGKIPRSSYSAHVLIFSLDAAQEMSDRAILDWKITKRHMERGGVPLLWIAKFIDDLCARFCVSPGLHSYQLSQMEKRQIYIVSNFIDAHTASQKKIATFLAGAEDSAEWLIEETAIKEESQAMVDAAKLYLSSKFDETCLQEFWEQSAARVIIHDQREIVTKMVDDKMLSKSAAMDLMEQIERDGFVLEQKRIEMHRLFVKNRSKYTTMKKSASGDNVAMAADSIPNPIVSTARTPSNSIAGGDAFDL